MQDTEYKNLIETARERAIFGFMALVQRAMQDADKLVVQRLSEARSNFEQSELNALRHFLRQDGNVFLRRIDALYRGYLERALQTMYVDLRPGMRQVSIDQLTLLDDEVVNRQIEVGRLAERMRDANEESIGRLNVIIARLHGERDARERENPFRPYLLARALYEAIRESVSDETKAKLLFEHLSNALIASLPGFYSAIREVFEASGLHGKFVAQPSRNVRHQRYFGVHAAPRELPPGFEAQVAPRLERLLDTLQQVAAATGDAGNPAGSVHELVRRMFSGSPPHPGQAADGAPRPSPVQDLLDQLGRIQQETAAETSGDASDGTSGAATAGNRLSMLRERLEFDGAGGMERVTVDVVAMLFEFILEDRQIPAATREHIARLQIPVLKAALQDPDLLHEDRHPARQLLNRLSSAAAAADPDSERARALDAEIARITRRLQADYDADPALFSESLAQFEAFLDDNAQTGDPGSVPVIEAIELAEKISVLLTNVTNALCELMRRQDTDKRISDFLIHVWPHVLVHAAWNDLEGGTPPDSVDALFLQCRDVLPELLWSVQGKQDAAQRSRLVKLLPELVRRINRGMHLIQLPDDERKEILDLLMTLHTRVLRSGPGAAADPGQSLEELRRDFARLTVNWDRISWSLPEPPQVRADLVEEVFARRALDAVLHLDVEGAAPGAADREFLGQTYLVGTRVELRDGGEDGLLPAQLIWISTHRSLYLFREERGNALQVYTCGSLLDALNGGEMVPLEYAPVFERAVESLLSGAQKAGDA